jgi:hypothetical protein
MSKTGYEIAVISVDLSYDCYQFSLDFLFKSPNPPVMGAFVLLMLSGVFGDHFHEDLLRYFPLR